MMEKIGVMVCGHGSRDEGAVSEFEAVARGIRARLPQYPVESGFLEFATPIIREGLDKLRAGGVTRCLAVPELPSASLYAPSGRLAEGSPGTARQSCLRQACTRLRAGGPPPWRGTR